MKDINPLDSLIELVKDSPTYRETKSWCLPSEFKVSELLAHKPAAYAPDKLLEPKPVAEFKPHDWKQLRKR